MAVILSEAKDPCISLAFGGGSLTAIDAVIPSEAARRRGLETASGLASLCLIAGLSLSSATAQTNLTPASANTAQPTKPFTFEVVSIHPHKPGTNGLYPFYLPDGLQMTSTFSSFISQAYTPVSEYAGSLSGVLGAPAWVYTDLYDIEARVSQDDLAAWQKAHDVYKSEPLREGLQAALRDRAKLSLHVTTVQQPCLDLVPGKYGLKLEPATIRTVKATPGKSYKLGDGFYIQEDRKRQFVGVSMEELALMLTRLNNGHLVRDKTGLTGRYDFTLPVDDSPDAAGSSTIPLDRMPVNSVGLALKSGTAPFLNINIDHIEKPDAN